MTNSRGSLPNMNLLKRAHVLFLIFLALKNVLFFPVDKTDKDKQDHQKLMIIKMFIFFYKHIKFINTL